MVSKYVWRALRQPRRIIIPSCFYLSRHFIASRGETLRRTLGGGIIYANEDHCTGVLVRKCVTGIVIRMEVTRSFQREFEVPLLWKNGKVWITGLEAVLSRHDELRPWRMHVGTGGGFHLCGVMLPVDLGALVQFHSCFFTLSSLSFYFSCGESDVVKPLSETNLIGRCAGLWLALVWYWLHHHWSVEPLPSIKHSALWQPVVLLLLLNVCYIVFIKSLNLYITLLLCSEAVF